MDSEESLLVLVYCSDTLSDLKRNILQKAGLYVVELMKKVFYKILMAAVSSDVQYETFVIGSDEDMKILFHCRRSFSEFWGFCAKYSVDDGGGASTSMPVVASGCLLAALSLVLASAARSPGLITGFVSGGHPDHVEDAMREDDSDDELDHISGDSEKETPVAPPAAQGPSSSGSYQQLPHFLTLNFEATKEKAMMSVKDYRIRRGVQYRVMESDHLKYVGRCKEFGNGCTWKIRVALRQCKGNWEVRRADAVVMIKVLQEATESSYGNLSRCFIVTLFDKHQSEYTVAETTPTS
ncbi:uncharacterized protein LOC130949618 [Arachis stenosperma]|uniref:uncharacterized protein LOC130949618 n=1 Tax=Arachis stenosperma TaxID=217475 RepID=UPI0025ABC63E|nr:uncharacterized protein LOC130949618 [Arachis stenosperma]